MHALLDDRIRALAQRLYVARHHVSFGLKAEVQAAAAAWDAHGQSCTVCQHDPQSAQGKSQRAESKSQGGAGVPDKEP